MNATSPAFPFQELNGQGMPMLGAETGLTKRELFAAMAMESLLTPISGDEDPQLWSYAELAKCAVKSADALLKELDK